MKTSHSGIVHMTMFGRINITRAVSERRKTLLGKVMYSFGSDTRVECATLPTVTTVYSVVGSS